MKKKIGLSIYVLLALGAVAAENNDGCATAPTILLKKPNEVAQDKLNALKDGKLEGYLRLHHINPSTSDTIARTGSVIGGKLKYETATLYGFSAGAALYAAYDTGLTNKSYFNKDGYNQVAGGLLGDDWNNYSTLSEAYIRYGISKSNVAYGRVLFNSPMTEAEVTIIPNAFEGAVATIKEFDSIKLTAAYLDKIQYGTRSITEKALIGDNGYGITAGVGLGTNPARFSNGEPVDGTGYGKENFTKMSQAAFGLGNTSREGLFVIGADYEKDKLKARIWDFYGVDMFNTIYADTAYKMKISNVGLSFEAQALKQDDVGNFTNSWAAQQLKATTTLSGVQGVSNRLYSTKISKDGDIDAFFWGTRVKAKIGNLIIGAAYNQNTKGHIIDPWGGNFGYTSSIFSRNENRAKTDSYKLGFNYDLSSIGAKGLRFTFSHSEYKSDVEAINYFVNNISTGVGGTHIEKSNEQDYVLDYIVPSVKNVSLKLFHVERKNDTRKYDQSHTRLIANLKF